MKFIVILGLLAITQAGDLVLNRHLRAASNSHTNAGPCSFRRGRMRLVTLNTSKDVTCVLNSHAISIFEDEDTTSVIRAVSLNDIFRPVIHDSGCIHVETSVAEDNF
jgi:hypothetical protein